MRVRFSDCSETTRKISRKKPLCSPPFPGKDGRFRFEDIPYGTWIVRELKPAEGFVLNEKSYPVIIKEDEQVVEITMENRHIYGDVEGLKLDEDGEIIEGALFGLFSEDETEFTEETAL